MFNCSKCGECCKHINDNEIYRDLDRGDGVCKYLSGNLCSIYDERPLICRVDNYYDIALSNIMSKEEYYKENYRICKILKGE